MPNTDIVVVTLHLTIFGPTLTDLSTPFRMLNTMINPTARRVVMVQWDTETCFIHHFLLKTNLVLKDENGRGERKKTQDEKKT